MTNADTHMIKKVYWHAGISGRKEAFDLQNRISVWSHNNLPALSKIVFDELNSGTEVICIPAIELDLGNIALQGIEQELDEVFTAALRDALMRYINNTIADISENNGAYIITEAQRQADILVSFFHHGYLPWNYSKKMGTVVAMMKYVLTDEPYYFIERLKDRAQKSKQITKRIALQLPGELLNGILEKAIPGSAGEILSYKQQTERNHKQEKAINIPQTELHVVLWSWILDYVLTEHTSTFNRKAFMRGMIRSIAAHQNLDYYELLKTLDRAMLGIQKNQKVNSDFLLTFQLIRSEDLNTEIKRAGGKSIPLSTSRQLQEDTNTMESRWLTLENYIIGKPYEGYKSFDINELIAELSNIDKKRLSSVLKRSIKFRKTKNLALSIFDNTPVDELTALLCETPPAISGQIIDLFAGALQDAGITILPAEIRNIYLDYVLNATSVAVDDATLLNHIIGAIAKHANKNVTAIAACIVKDGYKYVSAPFGNESLNEIKDIYKRSLNTISGSQLNKQIQALLTEVTRRSAKDIDALKGLLQLTAAAKPKAFYDCLVSADDDIVIKTVALMDTDTLLLVLNNSIDWAAKTSSTLAGIKSAHKNSATIPVLIDDIATSVFYILRQQAKTGLSYEPGTIVAPEEARPLTVDEFIGRLYTTSNDLKAVVSKNANHKQSLALLNELVAGWTPIVAASTTLSTEAITKKFEKLIESYLSRYTNSSAVYGNLIELITESILSFGIKGEKAQRLLEYTRIAIGKLDKGQSINTDSNKIILPSSIRGEFLNTPIIDAEQISIGTAQAEQTLAEQYPMHAAGIVAKMGNTELVRISNSSISFPYYCQALSTGNPKAEYIRRLATHYNFFIALIGERMLQHLKLKYWTSLQLLLGTGATSSSYLADLTKAAIQLYAGISDQNRDETRRRIKNNFGTIPNWLKIMLPAQLLHEDNITSAGTEQPSGRQKDETDNALTVPLLYYYIKHRGVSSSMMQSKTIAGIEEIIEEDPFALYLLLKYYSLTNNELFWLYKKTGFSSLSNAITSIAPGIRGQLSMVAVLLNAFDDLPESTKIKYIIWTIVAEAWVNNKLTTLSHTVLWQSIVLKAAKLYNIRTKKLIEDIQTIKHRFPPAYKLSFDKLIKHNHMDNKPAKNEKVNKLAELISDTGVLVNNSGMVLLNSYLRLLFSRLSLISEDKFASKYAQEKAVHCLQFLCTGQLTTPEHLLVLNKVLCGININDPISTSAEISQDEQQLMEGLIYNMIGHWPQSGCNTIDGFRGTWFLRNGIVKKHEKKWGLVIDRENRKPYDMLLNRSPFSFSVINYPWMEFPLYVDWVTG